MTSAQHPSQSQELMPEIPNKSRLSLIVSTIASWKSQWTYLVSREIAYLHFSLLHLPALKFNLTNITYQQLRSLNQRKASITGDLPVCILREFAYEICFPLTNILNASFQSSDALPQPGNRQK